MKSCFIAESAERLNDVYCENVKQKISKELGPLDGCVYKKEDVMSTNEFQISLLYF